MDDFDIAINELKYESRGTPTDRLKTEAEAAKLEKERLEKLEVCLPPSFSSIIPLPLLCVYGISVIQDFYYV